MVLIFQKLDSIVPIGEWNGFLGIEFEEKPND